MTLLEPSTRTLRAAAAVLWMAGAARAQGLPEGPGKKTFTEVCGACHDLDTALERKHDQAGWRLVVDAMAQRGASATDEELSVIVDYLTKNFGVAIVNPAGRKAEDSAGASSTPPAAVARDRRVNAGTQMPLQGEWPAYGYDSSGRRYSALQQIDVKMFPG